MDRVLDRLWIGSSADVDGSVPLASLGFSGVVDLRDGVTKRDLGVDVHVLAHRDGDPWDPVDVERVFAFIDQCLRKGKVLVVCAAGMSRSASMVIGYLVRCGWSAAEAHEQVKAVRPEIFPVVRMIEPVLRAVEP